MVTALFLIGLLLIVAVILVQAATGTSTNTTDVQQKNQIFDAAEAGANAAINALDQSQTTPNNTCTSGSITPYGATSTSFNYQSCVKTNNFAGASAVSATDPATSATISVPAGTAFVTGSASSSLTGETTYAEAIVKSPGNGLVLPAGALDAAGNGTFSGIVTINADNPPTNNDASAIANGNFTEAGTVTVQGPMQSQGSNTHAGTLTDTATQTGLAPFPFPTSSQVTSFASAAKTTAKSGVTMTAATFLSTCSVPTACSGNIYVSGPITTAGATSVTINGNGTVYFDGNITEAGTFNFTNKGGASVIVNGNITGAGAFNYSVTPGDKNALLMVLGTAGYTLAGTGQYVGIVYAPNGNLTLAGASGVTGEVAAGNNDTCNWSTGCGNVTNAGTFLINYLSGLTIGNGGAPDVVTLSYWEH